MGNDKWVTEEMCDVVVKKFESSPVVFIPPHGYAQRDNHSKEAMEWILWFQHKYHENVWIRHTRKWKVKSIYHMMLKLGNSYLT